MVALGGGSKEHQGVRDGWVDNKGVRLHYLDSGLYAAHPLVPIVFVPGALGSAERYLREMESLAPRRCLAISLRGAGKSEAPEKGYAFEDHVSDVEAIIQASQLSSFCLMAYSMGVPYAIEYAACNPSLIRGLVLGDYRARYPAIRPEWVEQSLSFPGANPQAVRGLQRESREVLLWNRLERIQCPVLIIRGGKPGSLLSEEAAELYREHLNDVIIIKFEDSDHALSKPSFERYIGTIKDFLQRLDRKQPPSMVV